MQRCCVMFKLLTLGYENERFSNPISPFTIKVLCLRIWTGMGCWSEWSEERAEL
jgi:hypothetical protein